MLCVHNNPTQCYDFTQSIKKSKHFWKWVSQNLNDSIKTGGAHEAYKWFVYYGGIGKLDWKMPQSSVATKQCRAFILKLDHLLNFEENKIFNKIQFTVKSKEDSHFLKEFSISIRRLPQRPFKKLWSRRPKTRNKPTSIHHWDMAKELDSISYQNQNIWKKRVKIWKCLTS